MLRVSAHQKRLGQKQTETEWMCGIAAEGKEERLTRRQRKVSQWNNIGWRSVHFCSTVFILGYKVKKRLRDSAVLLPLAAVESSLNLVFT